MDATTARVVADMDGSVLERESRRRQESREDIMVLYDEALKMLKETNGVVPADKWLPHIYQDPDFKEFIEMCDKVLTSKGHDYTQGDNTKGDALTFPGRLKNFYEACKNMPSLTPFMVLGVYWWKHVTAVMTFLDKGRVESEPIEGRLVDCVNYCGFLLFKMVRFEQRRAETLKSRQLGD